MVMLMKRRIFLAIPMLAACADEQEPAIYIPPGSPSYRHLTPLRLQVGRLEMPEPSDGTALLVEQPAPIRPLDVMQRMAQDRLSTMGGPDSARFLIQTARLTRELAAPGGIFSPASERLGCVMRCQLEIVSPDSITLASAVAEVRRDLTGPARDDTERAALAERVVKLAGQDLNVEFEFQLRRHLRRWLQLVAGQGETLQQPVERETLPPS